MVYYEKQGPRYHPAGAVKEPEIQTANPEARSSIHNQMACSFNTKWCINAYYMCFFRTLKTDFTVFL
jgi:hypothetical protein